MLPRFPVPWNPDILKDDINGVFFVSGFLDICWHGFSLRCALPDRILRFKTGAAVLHYLIICVEHEFGCWQSFAGASYSHLKQRPRFECVEFFLFCVLLVFASVSSWTCNSPANDLKCGFGLWAVCQVQCQLLLNGSSIEHEFTVSAWAEGILSSDQNQQV